MANEETASEAETIEFVSLTSGRLDYCLDITQIREIRRMMEDVDIDESSVAAQMGQLREALADLGVFGPEPTPGKRKAPHLKTVPAE